MPTNIFDEIKNSKNFSPERSVTWFQDQLKKLASTNPRQLMGLQQKLTSTLPMFKMCLYYYDAKHKDTLLFWDRFPLTIPFNKDEKGFTGLNLHYLPYGLRAKLLSKLLEFATDTRMDEKTKMKFSWKLISAVSKFPEVRPCIKRYLWTHVQSRFLELDAPEWKTAILLPVEQFVGYRLSEVFFSSRRKIMQAQGRA